MSSVLSEPLTLPCGVTLPNRLVKAAMTEGLADSANRATPAHEALYRRWARGGAGVLITGNVQIHADYLERPGNIVIAGPQSEEQLAGLRAMAAAATDEGAHIWMQISHAGRQSPASITKEPVAPSAVPLKLPGGQFGKPRALSEQEIHDIVERFAFVASVAKETGFSGIQLHAAHGYLISEFLSPIVNQRTDGWGGSLENRAKLLLAVVVAARARVGRDFPISVKLNSADFQKGGFSFEDCLKVVEWLGEAGVDVLEISGGSYELPAMMGADGLEPVLGDHVKASTRAREAYFLKYAMKVKEVAKMPVMVTGGFRTLTGMEAAITEDGVDLVGLGRPLCGAPDGAAKLLSGEWHSLPRYEDDIRIGPGPLGHHSPFAMVKTMNTIAVQGWCCMQILNLGNGHEPELSMGGFRGMRAYMNHEADAAKALMKARGVKGA